MRPGLGPDRDSAPPHAARRLRWPRARPAFAQPSLPLSPRRAALLPAGVHHRGRAAARHGAGEEGADEPERLAPDRSQLPGHHQARRVQDRHHARVHPLGAPPASLLSAAPTRCPDPQPRLQPTATAFATQPLPQPPSPTATQSPKPSPKPEAEPWPRTLARRAPSASSRARARSPTRRSTRRPRRVSASRWSSASAATLSTAPTSSTASSTSTLTPR